MRPHDGPHSVREVRASAATPRVADVLPSVYYPVPEKRDHIREAEVRGTGPMIPTV